MTVTMTESEPKLTLNLVGDEGPSREDLSSNNKRKVPDDEGDLSPESSPGAIKAKKRSKRGDHAETHSKGGGKAKANNDFVSSLFNHNPEIPKLELSEDVQPVHESIFADDTISSFDNLVHPYLIQNLKQNCNISRMTSVQAKAIPVILGGKDALIKSQTGSGKTLAYALPILHQLQAHRPEVTRDQGVFALVVVPTRELATQSLELFEKLCKSFTRIVPGILSGGSSLSRSLDEHP
jgi:primosomal protein N'